MDIDELKLAVKDGIKAYLSLSYLLILIPSILSLAIGEVHKVEITSLVAISLAITTLITTWFVKKPLFISVSLISSVVLVYAVAIGKGVAWPIIAAGVIVEALLMLATAMSTFKKEIVKAFPHFIRYALIAGIGIYMMYIGFFEIGFIKSPGTTPFSLFIDLSSPEVLLGLITIIFASTYILNKVPGALLLSLITSLIIGVMLGIVQIPDVKVQAVEIRSIGLPDVNGLMNTGLFSIIITLFLVETFHTIEAEKAVTKRKGDGETLLASSIGSFINGFLLLPSAVPSIELSIKSKNHLPNYIASMLFVLSAYFAPYFTIIPYYITSALLVVMGGLFVSVIRHIKMSSGLDELLTTALISVGSLIFLSPAYALTVGLLFYILIKTIEGEGKHVHPLLYITIVLLLLDYFKVI